MQLELTDFHRDVLALALKSYDKKNVHEMEIMRIMAEHLDCGPEAVFIALREIENALHKRISEDQEWY